MFRPIARVAQYGLIFRPISRVAQYGLIFRPISLVAQYGLIFRPISLVAQYGLIFRLCAHFVARIRRQLRYCPQWGQYATRLRLCARANALCTYAVTLAHG